MKYSTVITALIFFAASIDVLSMGEHLVEHGPSERPAEHVVEQELQAQLRERELLNERLKESKREQETLLREMKAKEISPERESAITDRLSELNKSQEQIQGQLRQVGTVVEALEKKVEAPTISVTPIQETPTVEAWKKNWSVATISKEYLEAVPRDQRNSVEVAIVDQFRQDVGRITAAQDKPVETRLTTAIEEFNKLQNIGLSKSLQAKLVASMQLGLQRIVTDRSMPSDLAGRVSTLERVADILRGKLKNPNPELVKVITAQARSLVTSEIQNHTLIADALKAQTKAKPAKPQQAYDAYALELKLLDNFNSLEVKYGDDDPALTEAKLDIAKRKTMLLDFVEARKTLLEGKGLWQKFADFIKPSDPLVDYVIIKDPEFYEQQQKDKNLYSIPTLYALPEDLIDIARNVLKRLESVADPKEKSTLTDELTRIKDLTSDPKTAEAFKGIAGYEAVLQSVTERGETRSQEEVAKKEALKTQAGDLINEINEMTAFENPEALVSRIDEVTSEIKKFAELTSLSETGKLDALNMMRNLQAWSDVLTLASSYHAMNKSGATAEAAHATVVALQEKVPSILNELNYKTRELFTDRVQIMEQQLNALTKIARVFAEPIIGAGGKKYTLAELKTYLSNFQTKSTKPAAEVWEALKSNGLVSSGPREVELPTIAGTTKKTTQVVAAVTEKGFALIEVGKQHELIDRRIAQLANFVKKFTPGKQPDLVMRNGSGREIILATELKLAWLIPDDEMEVLQTVYSNYIVGGEFNKALTDVLVKASISTQAEAKVQQIQSNKLKLLNKPQILEDIGDLLQNIRILSEKAPAKFQVRNDVFERLILMQKGLQDPTLTAEQKTSLRAKMTAEGLSGKILAFSDPQSLKNITGQNLIDETKTAFKEVGDVFAEGYSQIADPFRRWKLKIERKVATGLWWSILPASVVTFLGIQVTTRVGAPAVGTALAGPVGYWLSGFIANAFVANILAFGGAILSFAGLGYAAHGAEKKYQEDAKILNDELVARQKLPEEVKQEKWLIAKGIEKAYDTVAYLWRTELTVDLKKDEDYLQILQQKEQTFQKARAQLLALLDLPPAASDVEFQVAFKRKGVVLDKSWGINRWLIGRKIKNAADFMFLTGRDMIEAHQTYNGMLAGAAMKMTEKIAANNAKLVKSAAGAADPITNLRDYVMKIKPGGLSDVEFLTYAREVIQMHESNMADLNAFKQMLDQTSKSITRSTLFKDTTFVDTCKLLIDRQQQISSQNLQENFDALFKTASGGLPFGSSYPSVVVSGTTVPKKT